MPGIGRRNLTRRTGWKTCAPGKADFLVRPGKSDFQIGTCSGPGFHRAMRSLLRWMLVAVLPLSVFLLWLNVRKDPHAEMVLDHNHVTGVIEDEVVLAELEAAGPGAVEAFRGELRRKFNPLLKAEQMAFDWFQSQGSTAFNNGYSPIDIFYSRREHALNGVILLGEQALPAHPDVEALLTSSPGSQGQEIAALCAMRPLDPATISNAVAALSGKDTMRTHMLSSRFAKIWREPPPHLPALVASLTNKEEVVRSAALRSLAQYGPKVRGQAAAIVPLLSDPSPGVRPLAAYALGHIMPSEAPRAIAAMLVEQEFNDPHHGRIAGWVGLEPYKLYGELGPVARAAVPRLEQEFSDRMFASNRGPIAFALWRVTGDNSARIIDALAKGAESRIERFRLLSLRGLIEIGPPASNTVPVLRRVAQDPRVLIRRLADEALRSITQTAGTDPR